MTLSLDVENSLTFNPKSQIFLLNKWFITSKQVFFELNKKSPYNKIIR